MNLTFQPILDTLISGDVLLRNEGVIGTHTGDAPLAADPVVAAPAVKIDLTGIARPNGEMYLPRKFEGTTDIAFLQAAYAARMPVLLYGLPGTGKTAAIEAALPGVVTMLGTAETESADFLGSWVQKIDGNYEWVDGPLIVAMEAGTPLLIDEIALIDSRSLAVVYSVMDGRQKIPVTANPARGTVEAKDGFVVYGACNPNVPGAVMSDALLSRFTMHVEVRTDWGLAKRLGLGTKILTVARNLAANEESGHIMMAPQLRELLAFKRITETFGERLALRNFIAQARPEDRATYIEVIETQFGEALKALTL